MNKNMVRYKALMLDVDGTLVTYNYNALPSKKIQKIVNEAKKHVQICVATGRSFAFVEPILKSLHLNDGIAIVNNGAQVVDITTKQLYYNQPMEKADVSEIINLFRKEKFPFYLNEGFNDFIYTRGYEPTRVYNIYTREFFTSAEADYLMHQLSNLSNLTIQKTEHKEQERFGLLLSHTKATKQHGILVVAQMLEIKPHEIIGVGDGYNDFPMLMACGLKVAMGNANKDLKSIADYIAPTVEKDGVADVIEKYILCNTDEIQSVDA